jgi:hypothetical protein
LLFVVGPRRRKAEKERGETREQCGFWGRSKEGAQMIRKAQQRFFFSLSLLTFVKTPLYYYVLSRKEEATKVLKRKRQKPSFKASSRQRSTRYNAYYGSRRAILLEADGW